MLLSNTEVLESSYYDDNDFSGYFLDMDAILRANWFVYSKLSDGKILDLLVKRDELVQPLLKLRLELMNPINWQLGQIVKGEDLHGFMGQENVAFEIAQAGDKPVFKEVSYDLGGN